jgi:hypothetical protein
MDGCKVRSATGGTITAGGKGFTCCQTDSIEVRIMTGGATVMHLGIRCINQRRRIAMTAGAACRTNPYKGVMTFEKRMDRGEIGVAGETGYWGAVQAVLDCLPDDGRIKLCSGIVVTEGTVGTVQGVNVRSVYQCTGARHTENSGIAGMAVTAQVVYQPVIMCRACCMYCCTALMAGITTHDSRTGHFCPDDIIAFYSIEIVIMPIMTGGAANYRACPHIVAGGSYCQPVMPGQYTADWSGMTIYTAIIRGFNICMHLVSPGYGMAAEA